MNAGIDYGMGRTNINHETGIRYGVISQNSICQAWADSSQPVYPDDVPDDCDDCDIDPCGYEYSGDGYEMVDCLDSDVMVIASPYYTLAPFCSPCVPGACSIESACEDGAKAYCLGHDWFEDGVAPYPVYDVVYDTIVEAPRKAA